MTKKPKGPEKKLKKQTYQKDTRVQLFNEGKAGPIQKIQLPVAMITQIRGILFDIDLDLIRPSRILIRKPNTPAVFYQKVLKPWLSHHSVLDRVEVRDSGRGLHAILRFKEPVVFENEADRERWAAVVEVVQAALPVDPDQPGITATTRQLGSMNSKNNAKVRRIKKSRRVTQEEVLELFEEMRSAPFKTVLNVLTGSDRVSPCPVCGGKDTNLSAGDYAGFCYGSCGKVTLGQLYDLVLIPRHAKDKAEVRHAATKAE